MAALEVVRPFLVAGDPANAGDIVEVSAQEARELVALGMAKPADPADVPEAEVETGEKVTKKKAASA